MYLAEPDQSPDRSHSWEDLKVTLVRPLFGLWRNLMPGKCDKTHFHHSQTEVVKAPVVPGSWGLRNCCDQ